MKFFILSIMLSVCAIAENEMELKHFIKYKGNWDITVSGKLINGEDIQSIHLKGKLESRKLYGDHFLKRKIKMKGKNFGGAAADIDGLGFMFFDKEKKVLTGVEFMSDENSFAVHYKITDENRARPLIQKVPEVDFQGGVEHKADEVISFMVIKFEKNITEMNWINKKNKDVKFKVDHSKIENHKEALKKYQGEDSKWILKGRYLFREGQEKEVKFTEVIGKLMQREVMKVQFFENGKVKAFIPEEGDAKKIVWKNEELINDFDKLE